ncbi:hypothetical protein ACLB2K_073592 [Fragaria x ananassa]
MDDYPDLRQLMASRTHQFVQFPDPFSVRPFNNYNPNSSIAVVGSLYGGLELMNHQHGWSINGNDGSTGNNSRWPRQETLTLLEIRSSLDSKFKETNQKGPLWDEVSRQMRYMAGFLDELLVFYSSYEFSASK